MRGCLNITIWARPHSKEYMRVRILPFASIGQAYLIMQVHHYELLRSMLVEGAERYQDGEVTVTVDEQFIGGAQTN
jgi:hypothetical protein